MIRLDEGGQQRDLALIPAPPALTHVVEHFWIQNPAPKGIRRIVPDLSAHLIFWTAAKRRGRYVDGIVVGPRSVFFDLDAVGRKLAIGVRLRPGILPALVRDSASQFTDRSLPLVDIVGRSGARLLQQLAELPPEMAVPRIGDWLAGRLISPAAPGPDLLDGVTSVFELASALQRSRRSAYSRFSDAVGLPPKLALRIHRLHKALFELNQGRSFADAAATAGYSDQAHFGRESVSLLGEPPGMWRRRRDCSFVQDTSRPC
jgi:AraC-like DNA-binding protein